MALMSYRQYAEHRSCSLRAVQKAIGDPDENGKRTGRIAGALVSVAGGVHPKIDSVKADALWELNTDESKRSTLFTPELDPVADSGASTSQPPTNSDADVDDFGPAEDSESVALKKSYHQSKAKIAAVDLEERQLDLDERKGRLITLEEAKQLGFTTLRMLRDSLRNVGPRISAQVAAMSDPFQCEQLINTELDAVLSSITVDALLAEQADDDDTDEMGD